MQITIKYMAQLKQAAAVAGESVEVESPCAVENIVRLLAQRHGETFRRIVLDGQDRVQPALLLFVGEDQVRPDYVFQDGDVLTILAPMAGG